MAAIIERDGKLETSYCTTAQDYLGVAPIRPGNSVIVIISSNRILFC